jgi:hypothetical protein
LQSPKSKKPLSLNPARPCLADVGLLGIATLICHLADPVSVVVAGAIVGGNKVVDAIKAAAELAKKRDKG